MTNRKPIIPLSRSDLETDGSPNKDLSQELTYVYIASRGHSGSTLLERLLGNHSEFTAMGEVGKLSLQYIRHEKGKYPGCCSCGLVPMECPAWRNVALSIAKKYHVDLPKRPFDFRVSDIGLEEDWGIRAPSHWVYYKVHRIARHLGYGLAARADILKRVLTRSGKRWADNRFFVAKILADLSASSAVVDSSKDHLGMRDVYDNGHGRVRIIFLTRDVRGNVWSTLKRNQKRDAKEIADGWVIANKRILAMLKSVRRQDWLHVKYEDLCEDPARLCQDLCAFLGYEFEPSMLDSGSNHHTIGGNRIRYGRIEAVKQDFSWTDGLSPDQISDIKMAAGHFASSLGYSF